MPSTLTTSYGDTFAEVHDTTATLTPDNAPCTLHPSLHPTLPPLPVHVCCSLPSGSVCGSWCLLSGSPDNSASVPEPSALRHQLSTRSIPGLGAHYEAIIPLYIDAGASSPRLNKRQSVCAHVCVCVRTHARTHAHTQ